MKENIASVRGVLKNGLAFDVNSYSLDNLIGKSIKTVKITTEKVQCYAAILFTANGMSFAKIYGITSSSLVSSTRSSIFACRNDFDDVGDQMAYFLEYSTYI